MTKRKTAVSSLIATVVVLGSACVDQVAPTSPAIDRGGARSSRIGGGGGGGGGDAEFQGLEWHFARISEAIPQFGGMFFADGGTPTVYVTEMEAADEAQAAVANRFYAAGGLEPPINRVEGPVAVMQADYTFLQLAEWRNAARPVMEMAGVVYLDLDEASNRVAVGVEAGADRDAIAAELANNGVPAEAVVLRDAEPFEFAVSLQQRVRPLNGGLQIVWPMPPTGALFICTLGFNARRPGSMVNYFVTNSHCSGLQGGNQNTPYTQPQPAVDPTVIANEVLDPNYFTGSMLGFVCPAGRVCRFSDASLAQYTPGQDIFFGAVYRTLSRGFAMGSLEINDANPRFYLTYEAPFPIGGETLEKVGRTTGWTGGLVTMTCFDANVSGTNITQLCQDAVAAGVGGGDSGSPVFNLPAVGGGQHATLYGILWGSATPTLYAFSALENIELPVTELGELVTNPFNDPVSIPLASRFR